jgi:poly(3-hydroxybutyrate) depolymerase
MPPLRRRHALLAVHGLVVVLSPLSAALAAQSPTESPVSGFLGKSIRHGERERRYVCYVPEGERPAAGWPLVVFLHGMGECGDDGWLQTEVGLGSAIRRAPQRWPAVVLFPQKPDKPSQWVDHEAMVLAMVAQTERELPIDGNRRVLTGLSQGGAGAWAIGARTRAMWQAFAPVCGYGEPDTVAAGLAGAPVWAFHGDADRVVAAAHSTKLVAAVAAAGAAQKAAIAPLLTLYPGVGHNSWDKAYRDEALAEWLLAAPAARLGVHYLADTGRLHSASVVVRAATSSDGGPPFAATTTATWRFDGKAVAWTWERAHAAPEGRDGPSPAPRAGAIAGKPVAAFVAARLQALQKGGVFDLPDPVAARAPKGDLMTWREQRIEVELVGAGGPWRFARSLPRDAQFDPPLRRADEAVAAALAAIGELPAK